VPFSDDAAVIVRATKRTALHSGFRILIARKVLWKLWFY